MAARARLPWAGAGALFAFVVAEGVSLLFPRAHVFFFRTCCVAPVDFLSRPSSLADFRARMFWAHVFGPVDPLSRALLSPPRSWNQLGGATTQQSMLAQMAAITDRSRTVGGVPTSLADLGYNDVGLDDYWQACGHYGPDQCTYHNEEGTPVINPQKFPSMLDMTNYGHGLNLTVGWSGAFFFL